MKKWKCLLGMTWTVDTQNYKEGYFQSKNHLLCREKWHALGRGRSKVLVDDLGRVWGMECGFHCNKDTYRIDIKISKW